MTIVRKIEGKIIAIPGRKDGPISHYVVEAMKDGEPLLSSDGKSIWFNGDFGMDINLHLFLEENDGKIFRIQVEVFDEVKKE